MMRSKLCSVNGGVTSIAGRAGLDKLRNAEGCEELGWFGIWEVLMLRCWGVELRDSVVDGRFADSVLKKLEGISE